MIECLSPQSNIEIEESHPSSSFTDLTGGIDEELMTKRASNLLGQYNS